MQRKCAESGRIFEVGKLELELLKKLEAPLPSRHPDLRFRELLAFWPHFSLHRRKCDYSGRDIISTYGESCPYPVWLRELWLQHAAPPSAAFTPARGFFEQLWDLFSRCPIPHSIGLGNENCDYTDDWWYSRNCYLCHSGMSCEDSYYCFRAVNLKDCQYCVYSFDCELCRELVSCRNSYAVLCSINCRICRDSAFLFDCRNCEHCLFCCNLRGKRYCIDNRQYTKDEYFKLRAEYELDSHKAYIAAKKRFHEMLLKDAYWKALEIEQCADSVGAYLGNDSRCENCFFIDNAQDCASCFRGWSLKDSVDCVSGLKSELIYYSVLPQESCYRVRYCYDVVRGRNLEYCAFCHNCDECFACCGLVDKKFCIMNTQFPEEDYRRRVDEIHRHLQASGEYGMFFPPSFAANNYDDSLGSIHFPLTADEQINLGFRHAARPTTRGNTMEDTRDIPDRASEADPSITVRVFWDQIAERPFQIRGFDLAYALKNKVPLPHAYYSRVLKELFSWMPCSGTLREARCAISGAPIMTNFPESFTGKLVSEDAYLAEFP